MSIGGCLRRVLYWTNDFLHGRPVGQYYVELKRSFSDRNYGEPIQKKRLKMLLDYATNFSDYYKPYLGKELCEFPVVNKAILNLNHDLVTVAEVHIPKQKGKVHIQRTSGSTGTPFAIPQDTNKRNRRIAELKFFGEIVGYKSHEKLGQLRIWTSWPNKSRFQVSRENIYPISVKVMDDKSLKDLIQFVFNKRIISLRGYASWFDALVKYLERNPDEVYKLKRLKVCFAGSERLEKETKLRFEALLPHCPLISHYSDEEAGVMAQRRISPSSINDNFYMNHTAYIFELLEMESDNPVPYGVLGRIVITDLFNYAFPLIRYDTGDCGIFHEGTEDSGYWPYITEIYGRQMDLVFDIQGRPLHPMNFARVLKNLPGIIQYQFIQKTNNTYQIKIIKTLEFNERHCLNEITSIVGGGTIEIEYVEDIPVLASGKRKAIICEL